MPLYGFPSVCGQLPVETPYSVLFSEQTKDLLFKSVFDKQKGVLAKS